MSAYRVYSIDGAGRIVGPAEVIDAGSDAEAIRLTRQLRGGRYELWQENRRVVTFKAAVEARPILHLRAAASH